MKISVVVPLYNKSKYIVRCITSVFAQTYEDFEIIVVDDGSTDEGVDTLNFVYHSNPKLKIIAQENGGVSAARNRGLKESEGQLVAFLDADDEWLPSHLEDIAKAASAYPNAGLIGTGYREIGTKGYITEVTREAEGASVVRDYFAAAAFKPILTMSSSAVRRSVYEKLGGFTEKELFGEDLAFYVRYALCYQVAFHSAVSAIYHNYLTDGAANASRRDGENKSPLVIREMDSYRQLSKGDNSNLKRYLAKILYEYIVYEIIRGKPEGALPMLNNPLLKSHMKSKTSGLKWAVSQMPMKAVQIFLRFSRSRWGQRPLIKRDGVVFRIIARKSSK